jgi:hypothetical protein
MPETGRARHGAACAGSALCKTGIASTCLGVGYRKVVLYAIKLAMAAHRSGTDAAVLGCWFPLGLLVGGGVEPLGLVLIFGLGGQDVEEAWIGSPSDTRLADLLMPSRSA